MANETMRAQMSDKGGFIAALDQSGGSTPKALRQYGIEADTYSGDEAMFRLMHDMRVRIITAPPFTGEKVLGAILFERTMDGEAEGQPVPTYLWEKRGIVPLVKVDKGLEAEKDGVQLMKPMPELDALLSRAAKLGVYGTKMRSVIARASQDGIAAIVRQQFEVAEQISRHGLMPIIEPEVLIKAADKAEAEDILHDEVAKHLDALPDGRQVMLKLSIPTKADLYEVFTQHPKVERVVALSGGYPLEQACEKLARNHGMIASFSRALLEGLTDDQTDEQFDATLDASIAEIYDASVHKGAAVG